MKTLIHRYLATLLLSMTAQAAIALATDRLVDPTQPATVKAAIANETAGVIKVEAIITSGARMLAIVNGKLVRCGDFVGAVQIEEIFSDRVRYRHAGYSRLAHIGQQRLPVRRNVVAHVAMQKDQT